MAGDKVRVVHKVARVNRIGTKTQVAGRDSSGFLGVVFKIPLCVVIRILTDNFNGVFIRTNGSVRP